MKDPVSPARQAAWSLTTAGDCGAAEKLLLSLEDRDGRLPPDAATDLMTIRTRQGKELETLALGERILADDRVDPHRRLHVQRQIVSQWREIGAHDAALEGATASLYAIRQAEAPDTARFGALELRFRVARDHGDRDAMRTLLPELREALRQPPEDDLHRSGAACYAAYGHLLDGDTHAALTVHRDWLPEESLRGLGRLEWLEDRIALLLIAKERAAARDVLGTLIESRDELLGPTVGPSWRVHAYLQQAWHAEQLEMPAEREVLFAAHLVAVAERILELDDADARDLDPALARWVQIHELGSSPWASNAEERTHALVEAEDPDPTIEAVRERLMPRGLLTQCARCRRMRTATDNWLPIGHWFLGRLDAQRCTHGYCPPCYEDTMTHL